jgi:outer membrane usher protein FimD/PapC
MTTGPQDDPTTSFAANTPKLYAMFKTKGAKSGDKARGVLIAEDVGDVAPANTKVLEKTLDLEGDTEDGDFNFSKPTKGWPVGKYRVEVYVNDELATTAKFTIKAAKKKSGGEEEEEEESGD